MLNNKNIKLRKIKNKIFISKNGKIEDNLSKYEKKEYTRRYSNLRKIETLMKLPFEKWTKEELIDLIQEYDLYFIIKLAYNKNILKIAEFVYSGEFERFSTCEDFKKS